MRPGNRYSRAREELTGGKPPRRGQKRGAPPPSGEEDAVSSRSRGSRPYSLLSGAEGIENSKSGGAPIYEPNGVLTFMTRKKAGDFVVVSRDYDNLSRCSWGRPSTLQVVSSYAFVVHCRGHRELEEWWRMRTDLLYETNGVPRS